MAAPLPHPQPDRRLCTGRNRYRLYLGTAEVGHLLASLAGGCRHVWNQLLADCECRHAQSLKRQPGSQPSLLAWGDCDWHRSGRPETALPQVVRMGVLRSACGTDTPRRTGALGLDRNAARAADSKGAGHRMTDPSVEEARIRRCQRKMARQRKGYPAAHRPQMVQCCIANAGASATTTGTRRAAKSPSCRLREPLLRADDRIPRPFHGSGPMSTEQRLRPAETGIHRSVTVGLEWAASGVSWQSRQSLRGPWPTGNPRRPERVAFVVGSSGESLAIGGNPCRD